MSSVVYVQSNSTSCILLTTKYDKYRSVCILPVLAQLVFLVCRPEHTAIIIISVELCLSFTSISQKQIVSNWTDSNLL